ncbi:MAG: lipoate--protein ligase family protein [Elusimicrobiaceae bacterium]|nr:lipoate--protein ligase family protein [Elusimicrobiaceae bacterium]
MDKVKLIISPALDTYGQMAVDELLVSNLAPCIRFFSWDIRPQATFGYIQKITQAEDELKKLGINKFTRRMTGGGLVLHKDDLTFSLVFDLPSRVQPSLIYTALHGIMREELKEAGFLASVYKGESDYNPQTSGGQVQNCFTNPVADDLMQDGKKVLGGALRRFDKRVLYQGSLQIKDAENQKVKDALLKGFLKYLDTNTFETYSLSQDFINKAIYLAKTKYKSEDWLNKF